MGSTRHCTALPALRSDDGSVFVRQVSKAAAAAGGQVTMKLRRVCRPMGSGGDAGVGVGGGSVCSLWYDTVADDVYTGDTAGVTRVITHVTGIAYEVRMYMCV